MTLTALRVHRTDLGWVWRSTDGAEGSTFIADGIVTVSVRAGGSWVDVEGGVTFSDDTLLEVTPQDDSYTVNLGIHSLGLTAFSRIKEGRTVVVPNRHLVRAGEPAVCRFTRNSCSAHRSVTLSGRVTGRSVKVADPTRLRVVQSWVEQ